MLISDVLKQLSVGKSLSASDAEHFMNALMDGDVSPIQTAGAIAAMAVRGESAAEITGFAKAMRNHGIVLNVPYDVVDTCGTGGDGSDTFNISTAAAFVCAAAGVPVAKHGNRAASSKSGSADVLQALGVNLNITHEDALTCLSKTNLCFLFAPYFHPAMKHAAEPRKQLGFRTIFNILGPLTNPARAKYQVIGVFREDLVTKVATSLRDLGLTHALVVYGAGGLDELSLAGESLVAEVKDGNIQEYYISPEQVSLTPAPVSAVVGGDSDFNADLIRKIFTGERGAPRDVVLFNAGAALYVAGKCETLKDGVRKAAEAIDSRRAQEKLDAFVGLTNSFQRAEVV